LISQTNPIDVLHGYCEAVLSGDVIACKALVQAVERFYGDLERQKDLNFPYEFDRHAVNVYCRFIPKIFNHFEGDLAGTPIHLQPFQVFLIGNIFGWKCRSNGKRRFRKAFITMGRKGGKSILAAIIEIILGRLDGEAGAQVYTGATKLDQAKIVHRMVELMVRKSPVLLKDATIHKNNISFPSDSFLRPLGSDRPFDGTNTHGVVLDEVHAWQEHHRPFFQTMVSASGTRSQSLEFLISTAGLDTGYIYEEELTYARGILDGTINDDRKFVMIFELDKEHDFMDPEFDVELMLQANPNMGVSVPVQFYIDELNTTRQKPSAKKVFKLKYANQCDSSVEEANKSEDWDAAAGELSDFRQSDGVGAGVDAGGRDDLCSYALDAKWKIDDAPVNLAHGRCPKCKVEQDGETCGSCTQELYRHEAKSMSFIASDTPRDLQKEPYRTWIEQGKLIVCDQVITTLKFHLLQDCEAWG
jgi:phage terminase large subunit-like protein